MICIAKVVLSSQFLSAHIMQKEAKLTTKEENARGDLVTCATTVSKP